VLHLSVELTQSELYAQKSNISGIVISKETNKEIKKVKVFLLENDIAIDSAFTDKNGNYNFINLNYRNYNLKFMKKKYLTLVLTGVILNDTNNYFQKIYLNDDISIDETNCIFREKK